MEFANWEGTPLFNEINLIEIIRLLLRRKYWIILGVALSVAGGIVFAFLAPPVYTAYAIISPKSTDGSKGSMLSSLGSLGRGLSLGLSSADNNLNRLEVLLPSRQLAEAVIRKNNLLPVLFPEAWDAAKGAWRSPDTSARPTLRQGIERLRNDVIEVETDIKKNTLKLSVNLHDPLLASDLASRYLEALAEKLHQDAVTDAQANQEFLENRLVLTADPRMQERIQDLISGEIEKAMLVTSRSFDLLEKPDPPLARSKPKRKSILIFSLLMGFSLSLFAVLALDLMQRNQETFKAAISRA